MGQLQQYSSSFSNHSDEGCMARSKLLGKEHEDGLVLSAVGTGWDYLCLDLRYFPSLVLYGEKRKQEIRQKRKKQEIN